MHHLITSKLLIDTNTPIKRLNAVDRFFDNLMCSFSWYSCCYSFA